MPAWSRSHLNSALKASSLFCSGVPSSRYGFLLCICRLTLSPGTNGLKIRLILPMLHSPPGEVESSIPHSLSLSGFQACLWESGNADSAVFLSLDKELQVQKAVQRLRNLPS